MSAPRPIRALLFVTVGVLAPAQSPARPATQPPRLALEDAFLAAPQMPERVEVNGRIVVVADLVTAAREAGVADGRLARHCLEQLVRTVLQDELERKKAWLGDDDYRAAYAAYAEPYDKTPFTVKVLATKFKGYPSLEDFQQRWRVAESFARSLPKSALDDQALAAEAERSRDLLIGSGIEVELWFHEAKAGNHGQRDFAAALQRAETTRAALASAKDGAPALAADVDHMHLGAAMPIQMNMLRQQLRESEFTTWLRGGVAEALFRAAPGELLAPLRGNDGVWVARVVQKSEGTGKVDPKNDRTRDLLRQLLVDRCFRDWIDTAFASSIVRLPQDRPKAGR